MKRALHELSSMRSILENLLKYMEEGVFTVDKDGKITSFNKSAQWITGYCLDEVIGKKCSDIFKSSLCNNGCPLSKVFKVDAPVYNHNVEFLSKEGKKILANLVCIQFKNKKGEILGAVNIFQDITEIKKLQHQLLQSEKLAIMGQISAGVAHEINNPISGILTYFSLIKKKIDKEKLTSDEIKKIREYIITMERETSRISRIVRNLLDFSRKKEPDFQPLNLVTVLEHTISLLYDQISLMNIKVVKDIEKDIPEIIGDFGQLQQVFMNLILNAIQSMDQGGTLTLKISKIGKTGGGCFVNTEIKDTGCGIKEENLSNIFEPFFSTKKGEKGMGLGLGLAIVQRIIKDHRGSISVKTKLGQGTSFIIKLPAR